MVDAQALVEQGYRPCPTCAALLRPNATACRFCGTTLHSPPTSETGARTRQSSTPALNPQASRGHLGSLNDLPGRTLTLVVPGLPVQQGSMTSPAPGVLARADGSQLEKWRNRITTEALRVCTRTWVAANAGVRVDLVFTVPRPQSAPTRRPVPADGYRDVDKLTRAVCDALCPSLRGERRFRLLASDMRITGSLVGPEKTHPRPLHTHPVAMDQPGVVIRVTPAENPIRVIRHAGEWLVALPCPDPTNPPVSDPPVHTGRGTR